MAFTYDPELSYKVYRTSVELPPAKDGTKPSLVVNIVHHEQVDPNKVKRRNFAPQP